jgi:mono/diheme cytochrome c family protein/peroxiredoxin
VRMTAPRIGLTCLIAWSLAVGEVRAADVYPRGTLTSSQGGQTDLSGVRGAKATVLVFLSVECPISNGYVPALNALAEKYAPQGVKVVGLNSNPGQSLRDMESHRREYHIGFPVVKDAGASMARSLEVKECPAVCVFDEQGELKYRGRIDDRYGRRGGPVNAVRRADLEEALRQVLAGDKVSQPRTEVVGCPIQLTIPKASAPKDGAPQITYSEHIAPLLQRNCQQCHRPGGIGPFALMNYDQALAWADDIRRFTADGSMPPWKPVEGWGDFRNRRSMSHEEIQQIDRWVQAGCPEGDRSRLPPPPQFVDGWTLGEPDFILGPSEPYTVSSDGKDEYRCFVLPTNFDDDQYVVALEVLPGNMRVVHHVIAFIDTSGRSNKLDAADSGPGYTTTQATPGFLPVSGLGGWAPGNVPDRLPDGMAKVLPKGANVVMQVHYHKTGKAEIDQTRLGVHLAKKPIERAVRVLPVMPFGGPLSGMEIPAGADHHEIRCSVTLPVDMQAIGVTPHMHLLGKDMQLTATSPDGRVERLLYVKNWDFNWQEGYKFRRPVALARGTRIDMVAHFDNSTANQNNPRNPPEVVGWGEQTFDEMCIAFLEWAPQQPAKDRAELKVPPTREVLRFMLECQGPNRRDGKMTPQAEFLMKLLEKRLKKMDEEAGG